MRVGASLALALRVRGNEGEGKPHPYDRWQLKDRHVFAPDGRSVSLSEVALHSLHTEDQRQIMATASYMSYESPPPFAAQFAEVEVDTETGQVTVKKLVMAVDCGTAINPQTASGQIDGGQVQALGYAICEEMPYDGRVVCSRGVSAITKFIKRMKCPKWNPFSSRPTNRVGPLAPKRLPRFRWMALHRR